ncbi:MAG: metallophosphoesterase [Deltaproteobacteria bacterium]|nr:metallophosphoesterase [Deltaproteobacteria bacterium]
MSKIFLIIVSAVLLIDILWWLAADRAFRKLRKSWLWRSLLACFMAGQFATVCWIFAARLWEQQGLSAPPQFLTSVTFLWHLLILPMTLLLSVVGARLGWLASRVYKVWRRSSLPEKSEQKESSDPILSVATTRRQFLTALTVAAPPLITIVSAKYALSQLQELRVRSIQVPVPNLPSDLEGLRIALVSDMHVGTYTHGPALKRISEETSKLNADFVLLPGDLINTTLTDLSAAIEAVGDMQSKQGVFLSLGNHDLIDNGSEFISRVRARLPLLIDETKVLNIRGQPVELLGLPWHTRSDAMEASVKSLSAKANPDAFPILLAHHPHAFDSAARAGIPLTVSGHTHGGQLMINEAIGAGPLLFRYWSGLYRKPENDNAALVVSNGAGHWFPLRTSAPAEIVNITLHRA